MKVLLADQAQADLERIGDYIAQRSPERAISFVQELRVSCLELDEMAERFAKVERYQHLELRRRVHGNYLIFYRIRADFVEVVHILHGATNYEARLFPEG